MLHTGDIVIVKFFYAEGKGYKYRPALVVSGTAFHKKFGLCWLVMITSAKNESWADDIALPPSKSTGLNIASVIRPAKIVTSQIDKTEKIGKAPEEVWKKAVKAAKRYLR